MGGGADDQREQRDPAVGRDRVVGDALARLAVPAHGAGFWVALDERLAASEVRDDELGRALAALPTPGPAPDFWDRLDHRLRAEPAPAHERPAAAVEPVRTDAGAPVAPGSGRDLWLAPAAKTGAATPAAAGSPAVAGARTTTGGAAARDDLRARRERRRPGRAGAAAAALSVAAAVAFVAAGLVGGGADPAPRSGTAAIAAPGGASQSPMAATAAAVELVTGEVVERIGSQEQVWTLTLGADGSRREVLADGDVVRTYDAGTGTLTYANEEHGDAGVNAGYPPAGGPDDSIGTFLPLDLAAHVAGLARAGDPAVEQTTFLGRPAWRAELEYVAVPGTDVVWSADVTVDRQTSLPLSVVEDRDGTAVEVTFRSFEPRAESPAPGTFSLELPSGPAPSAFDAGFERVDPAIPGVLRPAPDALPAGFTLDQVARSASSGVTVVVYRRGFEHLVVRTAPLTGPTEDPFAAIHPVGPAEEVRLAGGAFAGPAELVTAPPTTPHVWASDGTEVVSVSGPLPGDELVAVAASLERG